MPNAPEVVIIPLSRGVRKTRPYDDAMLAALGESKRANCGKFTLEGGFEQHGGIQQYSGTAAGSAIVWMKRWYKRDGTKYFLALSEAGILFKLSEAVPATLTTLYSGLSGNPFRTAEINGWLYLSNGSDPFLRFDGTDIFVVGAEPPVLGTMAATEVVGGGRMDAGTYQIKVTYEYGVDGVLGESNPAPTERIITVGANAAINLTDLPLSTRSDVTYKNIYRTLVGGTDTYYWIARLENSQTTYTIEAADTELGSANYLMETNHDIPPRLGSIAVHKERIFGIDPVVANRVRFSSVLGSDVFPEDAEYLSDALAQGDGESVTTLFKQGTGLYGAKKTRLWVLNGDRNENFFWEEVPHSIGFMSEQSVVRGDSVVFGLGQRDVIAFDGVRSQPIELVRGLLDLVDDVNKPKAIGVYRDKKYYLAVQTGAQARRTLLIVVHAESLPGSEDGFACGTIERAYDTDDDGEDDANFEVASFCVWENENDRFFIGGYDGYIYEFDIGQNWGRVSEPQTGADFELSLHWASPNNFAHMHEFHAIYAYLEAEGGDLTFEYEIMNDSDDPEPISSGTQNINLDAEVTGTQKLGIWNVSRWNSA
jgi:hypothetical protein